MDILKNVIFGMVLVGLALSSALFAAGPAAVNLGTSGNFAVLAKSGISTTGTTSIVGDIGVSPIAATSMTGFGLIRDSSNQYSTSSLVSGKAYASNYAAPTPMMMTTAVSNMQAAYTDAAGRTNPTATELGAGNIGGKTIAPGLYKWSTGVTIPVGVTLAGGANDVWIFQIAQNLNVGNGAIVTLSGGAQAKNIFWQVAGQAILGTTSDFKGTILSKTAIVMNNGAKLNGRALAQTAVTMIANSVTAPSSFAAPASTPKQPEAASPTVTTPTVTAGTTVATTPQTTRPTPTGFFETTAANNPGIIKSPVSSATTAVSSAQTRIAQNMALGLPAGYGS